MPSARPRPYGRQAELAAKEESLKRREKLDAEIDAGEAGLREQERRIEKRADLLDQKLELLDTEGNRDNHRPAASPSSETACGSSNTELKQKLAGQLDVLQRIARLSTEEAREHAAEARGRRAGGRGREPDPQVPGAAQETCQQKCREILTTAIQRYAASHTAEVTVSTVDIPNDDMKGRIIGREGRNIRAFEKATGVDVIVDDTPGVVIVTGLRQRPPRDRQGSRWRS